MSAPSALDISIISLNEMREKIWFQKLCERAEILKNRTTMCFLNS